MKYRVGKDGKDKCKCKACMKEYTCSSKSRTSHLSRHIPKCHMIPQFHNVGEMVIDCEGKLRKIILGEMVIDCEGKLRKIIFDPKKNREILYELIIAHDLSFSVVKWRVFRKYHKFFNEDCQSISRRITKFDVMKKCDVEKENLKQQ